MTQLLRSLAADTEPGLQIQRAAAYPTAGRPRRVTAKHEARALHTLENELAAF